MNLRKLFGRCQKAVEAQVIRSSYGQNFIAQTDISQPNNNSLKLVQGDVVGVKSLNISDLNKRLLTSQLQNPHRTR